MTTQEAKNINIADYLQSLGFNPVQRRKNQLWYISPFREEKEPSFKINLSRNEWYDFGLGKGGNILNFIMELHQENDISQALKIISEKKIILSNFFSFRQLDNFSGFQNIKVKSLKNIALLQYLKERKIPIPLAEKWCKEIYFTVKGKNYFAIAFENNNEGFSIRNKYFKACTNSDITTIDAGSLGCCIFEGFMDFLSFLTLKNTMTPSCSVVILNSVNNLNKAIEYLRRQEILYTFLDNDERGYNCLFEIRKLGKLVVDYSEYYREYKDLNEYLCQFKK